MTVNVRPYRRGGWEYHIVGEYPDGTRYEVRRKSKLPTQTETRRFAERKEQSMHEAWRAGEAARLRPKAPKLVDFYERCLEYDAARRCKPSTIATKRVLLDAHILPLLGERRVDEIGEEDVDRLVAKLSHRSPKTTNNVLSVLARILDRAEKWKVIAKAPRVELVPSEKRVMSFLSTEHYDRLVEGARKVSPKALVLVLLAGDAGLRRGEILALEWAKVDLSRRVVMVDQSETLGKVTSTKGRAWRVLPMTEALREALEALPHRSGRVLSGRTSRGGIERKTVAEFVRAAERAAGLPVTGRLHVLRHTYASHLAMAGESLYQLQQALGHQDHNTTQGYAHLTAEALRPLAAAIDSRRKSRDGRETKNGEVKRLEEPTG